MVAQETIGPTVAWTSAGFLYIHFDGDDDDREEFVNVLDRTRVHPESYMYALKIARDAIGELPNQEDDNDSEAQNNAVRTIRMACVTVVVDAACCCCCCHGFVVIIIIWIVLQWGLGMGGMQCTVWGFSVLPNTSFLIIDCGVSACEMA